MTTARPLPVRHPRAFTILELLVVIAILAILASLLLPALRGARASASKAVELAGARQLMMGYTAYAYDHRGALLPGFSMTLGLPAVDHEGEDLSDLEDGRVAARYPWRLAPWLDFDLRGLIQDESLLDELISNPAFAADFAIWVSVLPSLGLNVSFVGGDFADDNNALAHPDMQAIFGRVHLARLSEARHPARLITFASARVTPETLQIPLPGGRSIAEGYFRVDPPYLLERVWADRYAPALPPYEWGNVSLRHHHRRAVIGFLDGHTGLLDEGEIQDMRYWSDRADTPEWTLPMQP